MPEVLKIILILISIFMTIWTGSLIIIRTIYQNSCKAWHFIGFALGATFWIAFAMKLFG